MSETDDGDDRKGYRLKPRYLAYRALAQMTKIDCNRQ